MKVYSHPVTRNSNEIEENFIQQLKLSVNIEETQKVNRLQIIIFKPTSRPRDEFDDLVRVFGEEGGNLDEDTIFITARKGGRSQFKPPSEFFKLVLQTSVYLTDENKIDPRSDAAVTEIADVLIQKYGFPPCSPVRNEVEPVQVEVKETKINTLEQENKLLKRNVEVKKTKIKELEQENKLLKRNVEENGEEENERLDGTDTEIQFKCKMNWFLSCCSKDQIKSVNLRAIHNEITNMREKRYDFQRTCEKELGLKPGNLPGVLKYIRKKSKIQGVSRSVIEGQQLEHLIEELTRKFGLTEDHFNWLLNKIYKKNKRDKRGGISSQGEYGSL